MIPASALIDNPVQCPKCGQPLNPFENWSVEARGEMPCCSRPMSVEDTGRLVEACDVEVKRRQAAHMRREREYERQARGGQR